MVRVAENVAGAVDAGALAVPDPEDAVVFAFAPQLCLLRSPKRSGCEVLVEARMEEDVVFRQNGLRPEKGAFEACDRGTAIAGDVSRGVQPRLLVPDLLHQREPDDGLGTCQDLARLVEVELV